MGKKSIQHTLDRVRAPRVHITYDVAIGDAIEKKEIPYVVGVLGDFSGKPDEPLPKLQDRKFVEIDRDNFDNVLAGMMPRLVFRVDNKLAEDNSQISVELRFKSLDDFHPEQVAQQIDPVRKLLEERRKLSDLVNKLDGNDRLDELLQSVVSSTESLEKLAKEAEVEPPKDKQNKGGLWRRGKKETQQATAQTAELKEVKGLLDHIIEEGRMAREETQKTWARDLIGELVAQIMEGTITVSKDTRAMINARISVIDHLVSKQLNEVLHHPDFQKLEASWRGLHYLVNKSETGERIKLRVLNMPKADFLKDMEKAALFDQSALFKKVYEAYGMFGGAPYGALIGDYEFSNHPQDLTLLAKISGVAASADAPFIAAASPKLLNLDSFTQLGAPRDIAKIFQGVEYVNWKAFRDSEDSRYVALVLPHILMRLPYGKDNVPVESFSYEEDVTGADHGKYLWGNAAYALGTRLTHAFARYSWCAAISGVEGGGLVDGLPVHTFQTDAGDLALKCPVEIAITDRREKELADLGFIPLVHCKGTDYAVFLSTQSSNKPKMYDEDAANANARRSSQIQYILAVSRFAHYLKSMMRDNLGSFMSCTQAEDFLNRWIAQYILLDDSAGQQAKASHPLREARIKVSEIPGRPGAYQALAFLKPYFQLDELTVSLRLVAFLPPQAKG